MNKRKEAIRFLKGVFKKNYHKKPKEEMEVLINEIKEWEIIPNNADEYLRRVK